MNNIWQLLKENWLLAISTPLYIILISLEIIFSNYQHKNYYSVKETAINLWLNIANFILGLSVKAFILIILLFFSSNTLLHISNNYLYWILLFFGVDFCFYWEHRVEHMSRFFWAIHVTHHSSKEYNLTTGFRSSVFRPFISFFFWIPLIMLGFKPLDIMLVDAICQIYGIMVHTQYVKKMPNWFEIFFVSPSHHRVHHASNIPYLDKNMGMCLIIWDKIFGTFQYEFPNEKLVFGLVKNPEEPYHPIKIIFHEWVNVWHDFTKSDLSLKQRFQYLFMPPGWSHDGSTKTAKQLREDLKIIN